MKWALNLITKNPIISLLVLALALALGRVALAQRALSEERQRTSRLEIGVLNERARATLIDSIWIDSTLVLTRMNVQLDEVNDSLLDRIPVDDREARAVTTVVATVDEAVGTDSTELAPDSAGVRSAEFHGYEEPYTFVGYLTLYPDARANLRWSVALDDIQLTVGLSCRRVSGMRSRSSHTEIAGPFWFKPQFTTVASRDVCNPPIVATRARSTWWWPVVGVLGGAFAAWLGEGDVFTGAVAGGAVGTLMMVSFDIF